MGNAKKFYRCRERTTGVIRDFEDPKMIPSNYNISYIVSVPDGKNHLGRERVLTKLRIMVMQQRKIKASKEQGDKYGKDN